MSRTSSLCLLVATAVLAGCREDPTSSPLPVAETSAAAVTPAPLRVKWRFKLAGDYSLHSPGVAADGTVYVAMSNGKLYAVAPNGTQRWVVQAGLGGGAYGPVSVGADGTIYVAGMVPAPGGGGGNTGAIFAYTPAGTQKWVFNGTKQLIKAGPSLGPDGNIYAVTRLSGIGLFSLTPAGQLRFSTGVFGERGLLGEAIAFGPTQMYFAFDMYATGFPASLFSYDFNGGKLFQVFNIAQHTQPAVGPNGNVVIESSAGGLAAYAPSGAQLWSFYHFPGGTEIPDVGPDNIAYTVSALATLSAINPGGGERWRYVDANILFEPKVRRQNDLLFMGGRLTYGAPGFFQAVSTGGAALWRVNLPDEPGFLPYGQLVPSTRPVFSPDGNTAYAVTDVAGDGASSSTYSFLYAINLSAAPPPGNTPPLASLAATTATTIRVGGSITVRGRFTDPDNGPWTYLFIWGNGRTGGTMSAPGSITAKRTYTKAGTFRIRFIVTDALGAADTSNAVTVTVR